MLSVKEIIDIRAPQFSSSNRLDGLITLSTQLTGGDYGENQSLAIALRVLHILTKEKIAGGTETNTGIQNSGGITSETEGALSRSYSSGSSNQFLYAKYGDLTATTFGMELIDLMKSTFIGFRNRTI
jgi:hypothetical protein